MEKQILPIGTVIESSGIKTIIIGYTVSKGVPVYMITGFPLGVIDSTQILQIPMTSEFIVVQKGYEDENATKYLNGISEELNLLENVSLEEVEKCIDYISAIIRGRRDE